MPRGQSSQGFTDGTITIGTNVDTAGINSGLAKISKSFKRLGIASAKMLGVAALFKLGQAAVKAASDLQEVQNIVDVTFGDLEWKMEKFAKISVDAYGMSEFTAKQTASSFMAMGKASGIAAEDAANMALQLTALAGDMASFYNISQDYAKVALSAVYTGETETLKRYGIILTEANLQEYASSKGLDIKVKKLDAASKAMLRYQYILEHTEMIEGDFIRTQDNWANQVRVLQERWKQFLITIGSGFITILTPVVKALNVILQYVTAWANAVGKILAKLMGIQWQDFSAETAQLSDATADAAESEEELGNNIEKAGKKAKKALAPFDELNVLTDSAAGNASGLGDSLGFAIDEWDTNFDVKDGGFKFELPDISDWYEFGKFLSDTLKNLLDNIPWDTIQEKVKNFAHNLAELLNGFFQPETFESIGKTIAEALNTAIDFAFEFGTTFDFTNFGLSLAAAVNGFFKTFDFAQFADTIDVWVQGLWDAIKAFFLGDENREGGIDWPLLIDKLKEFLTNLDVETIELIVGYLLIKNIGTVAIAASAAKKIATAVAPHIGQALWNAFAYFKIGKIASGLGGGQSMAGLVPALEGPTMQAGISLGTILLDGIAIAIAGMGGSIIGANLGGVIETALGGDGKTYEKYMGLTGFIDMYKDLGSAIKDFFDPEIFMQTSIFEKQIEGAQTFQKNIEKLKTWFDDIGYAFSHVFDDIKESLNGVWTNIQSVWGGIVQWFTDTIITPLSDGWNSFVEKISGVWNWFSSLVYSIFIIIKAYAIWCKDIIMEHFITPLIETVQEKWALVKSIIAAIRDFFVSVYTAVGHFIVEKINQIKEWYKGCIDYVRDLINAWWEAFKSSYSKVFTWVKTNIIDPVKQGYEDLTATISLKLEEAWNFIKSIWETAYGFIHDTFIQPVQDAFNNLWDGVTSGCKTAINSEIEAFEGFINFIIDGINAFTGGISTIASAAAKITGDDYSGIGKISHISLPRLAEGAVIPPNKEFAAILGDQKHGTNIEAPLDTIVNAFKMAMSDKDNANLMDLMTQQVQLLQVIANKEFGITDNQIFNSVKKSASQYTVMTGQNAF